MRWGEAMLWLLASVLGRLRARRTRWLAVMAGTATVIAGTLFAWIEHVSWFLGIYWAVVTVTTVGYGDVVARNPTGRVLAVVTMVVVIPMVGALFADWAAAFTMGKMRRLFAMEIEHTEGHLVLLGYTPLVPHLLQDLAPEKHRIVVVADIDSTQMPGEGQVQLIAGNPQNPHVLARAHLDRAARIVIVGESDGDVLMTAIEAHALHPDAPIMALAHSSQAVAALSEIGVNAISTGALVRELIAKSVLAPHALLWLKTLFASADTVLDEIPVPPEWVGRHLSEVRTTSGLIIGVIRGEALDLGLQTDPLLDKESLLLRLQPGTSSSA